MDFILFFLLFRLMSGESSEEEDGPGADQGDRDDTNAIQQVQIITESTLV